MAARRTERSRRRQVTDPDANERLFNFEVSHQIGLLRVSGQEANELLDVLDRADDQLAALIARTRPSSIATRDRSIRLRGLIAEILGRQNEVLNNDFRSFLGDATRNELETQSAALGRIIAPVGLDVTAAGIGRTLAAVRARPFEGDVLSNWVRQLNRNDLNRTWRTIQAGIVAGQTTDQITRAVIGTGRLRRTDGVREVTRRGVRSLSRTALTHAAAVARAQLFDANSDIISGELIVATLDARTTAICRSLDGDVFPLNEGPRPPFHFQCRTTTSPIIKPLGDNGVAIAPGSRASKAPDFTGQVPSTTTYEPWLRARPAAFQDEVLGKTKGALFRRGGVSLDQLVSAAGDELTIPQLRRKLPGVFTEIGI